MICFNGVSVLQVYGFGKSEELIGDLAKITNTKPVIATKFAPLPWRFTADNVVKGIKVGVRHCHSWNTLIHIFKKAA